jgi:hypothetical protein
VSMLMVNVHLSDLFHTVIRYTLPLRGLIHMSLP